jgi:hypothetical protein
MDRDGPYDPNYGSQQGGFTPCFGSWYKVTEYVAGAVMDFSEQQWLTWQQQKLDASVSLPMLPDPRCRCAVAALLPNTLLHTALHRSCQLAYSAARCVLLLVHAQLQLMCPCSCSAPAHAACQSVSDHPACQSVSDHPLVVNT